MTVALAAMVFASCSNEQNDSLDDGANKPAHLSIKLAGVVNSNSLRSIEAAGTDTTGTILLENGHIFILTPTGTVTHDEPLKVDEATNGTGQRLLQDVPSDSRVYIIGNIPADVDVDALNTLANIQEAVGAMTSQTNYRKAALANAEGTPVQITLNGNPFDNDPVTTVEATVTVSINPVISRLELGRVTGSEKVTGFTVEGVYVDNWYPSFTYGGLFSGAAFDQKQDTTFTLNTLKDVGIWPATSANSNDLVTNPFYAISKVDSVWAYNVAAGGLPRLIIKLTNVSYMVDHDKDTNTAEIEVTDPATLYLTVTGYTDTDGPITEFKRGRIYNIGGNTDGDGKGIVFDPDDTGLTPNPVGVTLDVTVGIKEWEIRYPTATL